MRCPYCHCDMSNSDDRLIAALAAAHAEQYRQWQDDCQTEMAELISRAEDRGIELWQLLDEDEEMSDDYEDDGGCDWHCTDDEDGGELEFGMSEVVAP